MPGDNVDGLRADTLPLLKELKAPIYRWPGGNFVSGYDWRDGIGDRDRRPPRTNPAWTGVEHNDFGMDEFIRFCRVVGSEPWITVNTGFGDAHSAADQLEYCNGAADSHWGARRAANGSPAPCAVKYWGIGNEMFGNWQLGHMQLPHYVLKQNWVVDKMREVDPAIICIASGDAGPWSEGLLKGCAGHMNFIAEHFYCQEKPDLAAHVRQIPDNIRRKADNVIGAIKTSRRNAAFETTGLVLKLYRQHFGTIPATTTVAGSLDAQAAWSSDRKKLTLGVVNPTMEEVKVPLAVEGARLKGTGTRWQIAGSDPMAFNDPDREPVVRIEEQAVKGLGGSVTLAPCSVTVLAIDVE